MFVKTVKSMGVRDWLVLVALSLVVAFCGVYGWSYGLSGVGGYATLPPLTALLFSLGGAVGVGLLILVCNAALTKLSYGSLNKDVAAERCEEGEGRKRSRLGRFTPSCTLRSVVVFSLVMLLFWSPYAIAAFPGETYNDTTVQMQQVYEGAHPLDVRSGGNVALDGMEIDQEHGNLREEIERAQDYRVTDAWLVDHHPFALTLFYGFLASTSDALFGNWMPALGLLMVLQVVVLAVELTGCVAFLRKRGAPLSLCFAAYALFCLLPLFPLYACFVIKDTAFTLFFIPWFLLIAEGVLTKGEVYAKKRFLVAFVVLAVLMCLTKKTGVYVVGATALFGLIVSLIAWRRTRKGAGGGREEKRLPARAAALAFLVQGGVCAFLMFVLVPFIVFPALNIEAGSRGEAMGVMFQQTARVYRDVGPEALTSEEREAVQGVMRVSGLDLTYLPIATDKVKGRYYLEATDEQMGAYLRAYAEMGLRYPDVYMGSVLCVASGYLSPTRANTILLDDTVWSLTFDDGREVLWPIQQTAPLRDGLKAFLGAWQSIPGLNLPFCAVVYDLWVPAVLLFFCLRNRLKGGILFIPLLMVTVFCVIGPIYDLRYALPDVMLAPVMVGVMVAQAKCVFKQRADRAIEAKSQPS